MLAQRFELKYIIPDSITVAIDAFIAVHMELDPYADKTPDCSYSIHSIYLDSDKLHTYHAGIQGDRNRFKLRVRFYDDNPESVAFLELKRRHKDIIQKKRCMVPRHAVMEALAGDSSYVRDKDREAHDAFCHHMYLINATPRVHVGYEREAWVSRDDSAVRVTIDRNVRAEAQFDLNLATAMSEPVYVFGQSAVLELKFTDRAPNWMFEMVRLFNLKQSGGPKYAGGIRLIGEQSLHGPRNECFQLPAIPLAEECRSSEPPVSQSLIHA